MATTTIITSLLIGLTAGAFGGILGIGGGLIMIPLMVEVLKLTQHKAHGTSLVALVFTGIGG
ncbi:MAG: TSUP family transporter, partial [Smithella sp.]